MQKNSYQSEKKMLDGAEYSSSVECLGVAKRKKSKSKRRFSDEQIRSLEVMFETETKLEPNQKVQLARELGLQPRQVAIWFQNKRARWKSKHLETDYSILLADYNTLASKFDLLMKEKHSLLAQLQKLKNETAGKADERKNEERGAGSDGESDNCRISDFEGINNGSRCLAGMLSVSEDDRSIKAEFMGLSEEENELLKMVEPGPADSSLTSVEDWGSLDSDDIMNQASDGGFQWWDFWS